MLFRKQVGVINEMVVTVLAASESQAGFSILSHRLEKLGDNAALPSLTLKPPGYFSGDHSIWCCAATGYCLRKETAPPMDE